MPAPENSLQDLTSHWNFIIILWLSGCGEAWYRAWFGSKRPRVRIPTLRPKKRLTAFAARRFLIVLGFEEGGRHDFVGKKYAGGIFFSPGENPFSLERTQYGCGQEEI